MKRIQISKALLLSVLVCPAVFADIHDRIEYKLNRVLKDVEVIINGDSDTCTPITQLDIDQGGGVYTINTSGSYCLRQDVLGTILINSSDVCLDLGCHSIDANGADNAIVIIGSPAARLEAVPSVAKEKVVTAHTAHQKAVPNDNQRPGPVMLSAMYQSESEEMESRRQTTFKASFVGSDFHNVSVFNGTVKNAADAAILVDTVDSVTLFDLDIYNNTLDGVRVLDSQALVLEKLNFAFGDCAMNIDGVAEATIRAVNIHDHTVTTDALVIIQNSDCFTIDDVNACGNSKVLAPVNTRFSSRGLFDIFSSSSFRVNNLDLSHTLYNLVVPLGSPNATLMRGGLYMFDAHNYNLNGIKSNNCDMQLTPFSFFGIPVGGIYIISSWLSSNGTVTNCEVNDNVFSTPYEGAFAGAIGYANSIESTEFVYENCQHNGNQFQDGLLTGFLTGDQIGNNTIIRNCQTNNNTIAGRYILARGITDEVSTGLVVDNFHFNGNSLGDAAADLAFSDVNAVLIFSDDPDATCKNIQCSNNTLGQTMDFHAVSSYGIATHIENVEFNDNTISSLLYLPDFSDAVTSAVMFSGAAYGKCVGVQANGNFVADGGEGRINDDWRSIFTGVNIVGFPIFGVPVEGFEISDVEFVGNEMANTPPFTYVAGIFMDNGANTKVSDSYFAVNRGGDRCNGIFNHTYYDPVGAVNNEITNCTISELSGAASGSDGIYYDGRDASTQNTVITGCKILACEGAGIEFVGENIAAAIIDCVAIGNDIGFEFAATSTASCCLVQDCRALSNTTSGFVHATSPLTTAFIGNEAQCNGAAASDNFVINGGTISLYELAWGTGLMTNISGQPTISRWTNVRSVA